MDKAPGLFGHSSGTECHSTSTRVVGYYWIPLLRESPEHARGGTTGSVLVAEAEVGQHYLSSPQNKNRFCTKAVMGCQEVHQRVSL